MKIVHVETVLSNGKFASSEQWSSIRRMIMKEIEAVDWPPGSGTFSIFPESGKRRGEGNGVKPIKDSFVTRLIAQDWQSEVELDIAANKKPGKVDLLKPVNRETQINQNSRPVCYWKHVPC